MLQNYPKTEPGETDFAEDAVLSGTGHRTAKIFQGYNCGSRTYSMVMSLRDVEQYTEVDPAAQRPLDPRHAQGIAQYMLKGLAMAAQRTCANLHGERNLPQALEFILATMELGPYMSIPPLVTSFRECKRDGEGIRVTRLNSVETGDLASYQVTLHDHTRFWVIDGQHRREALRLVQQFLSDIRSYHRYPTQPKLYRGATKGQLSSEVYEAWQLIHAEMHKCKVTLEVHLGLNMDQEKQLFHDLNNLGMSVKKHVARDMDSSNPVTRFTKEQLRDGLLLGKVLNGKVSWEDPGYNSDDLVAVNSVLLLNKTRETGARSSEVNPRLDSAKRFWEALIKSGNLSSDRARQESVLAQPVVMKALGKLWYDFNWGKKADWTTSENQRVLELGISRINFSHTNAMWQYYTLDPAMRRQDFPRLQAYLPAGGNDTRDLGMFDGKYFKFGIKHNDIFPIIGDMVRCTLELPSRQTGEQVALSV